MPDSSLDLPPKPKPPHPVMRAVGIVLATFAGVPALLLGYLVWTAPQNDDAALMTQALVGLIVAVLVGVGLAVFGGRQPKEASERDRQADRLKTGSDEGRGSLGVGLDDSVENRTRQAWRWLGAEVFGIVAFLTLLTAYQLARMAGGVPIMRCVNVALTLTIGALFGWFCLRRGRRTDDRRVNTPRAGSTEEDRSHASVAAVRKHVENLAAWVRTFPGVGAIIERVEQPPEMYERTLGLGALILVMLWTSEFHVSTIGFGTWTGLAGQLALATPLCFLWVTLMLRDSLPHLFADESRPLCGLLLVGVGLGLVVALLLLRDAHLISRLHARVGMLFVSVLLGIAAHLGLAVLFQRHGRLFGDAPFVPDGSGALQTAPVQPPRCSLPGSATRCRHRLRVHPVTTRSNWSRS